MDTLLTWLFAAAVLGFGRATGEAIAVSQVIGGISKSPLNLFSPGVSLGSMIANQWTQQVNNLQISSLYYLALILLIIGVVVNLVAKRISAGSGGAK